MSNFLQTVTSGAYLPTSGVTTILREGLYDVVTNVDPFATQVLDMLPGGGAIDSPIYQWPIDNLPAVATTGGIDAAGISTGGVVEGFTPNFGVAYPYAAQPQRVTNFIQMFAGKVAVTDTLKRAKPAGVRDPYNWEVIKVTRVIKKAIETRLFDNPSTNANFVTGTSADPRTVYPLIAWAFTTAQNVTGSLKGASPDSTNIIGTTNVAGTLTPAFIDAGMEAAVTAGGEPNVLAMSLGVKFDISAQLRSASGITGSAGAPGYPINWSSITAQEKKIIRNVEIYQGDAGELMFAWTRQMPQSASTTGGGKAWLLQTNLIQTGFYSPVEHIPLAKTGHNTQGIVVGEWGYRILSPKAHWVLFNVTT